MNRNEENFGENLSSTLAEIARTPNPLMVPAGPNSWDMAKDDVTQFGPEEDFTVDNEGDIFIFTPVSKAAIQWCYAKLPEDCPRWSVGYVIEHRFIADIVIGARRDNLMSREDYEQAMNEKQEIERQWL